MRSLLDFAMPEPASPAPAVPTAKLALAVRNVRSRLRTLSSSHVALTKRVEALEARVNLLETEVRLDRRLRDQLERVQDLRSAVSTMQGAAYGQRGNVFATNNVLLGGSELLWSSLDGLFRRAGWWSGASPLPLSWIGPVLGLVAGHLTVGDQQFERFVSGELTLRGPGDPDQGRPFVGTLDLVPLVAKGFRDEFRKKASVPASAVITEANVFGVTVAQVAFGTLAVVVRNATTQGTSLNVHYTVDVGAIDG